VIQTDSPKPGKLPSGVLKIKSNRRVDRDDWLSNDCLIPLMIVNPTSLQVVRDEADAQPRHSKTYGTVSAEEQKQMNGLEFVQGLADGTLPLNTTARTLGYEV